MTWLEPIQIERTDARPTTAICFGLHAMTAHRIGFLIWPGTKALTLALAEEALRVAQRVHPEVTYELSFLQAGPPVEGGWQLPGEPWTGRLEGCQKLFLLADEPPAAMSSARRWPLT